MSRHRVVVGAVGGTRKPRPLGCLGGLVGSLVVVAIVATVLASVGSVIYPGVFELTAPVLCPEDQPDPHVLRYNVSTSDGTATNFTLFCMGERGEFTEVGTWRPLGLTVAGLAAGLLALILALRTYGLARRGSRAPDIAAPPDPAQAGGPIVGGPISGGPIS